MCVRRAAGDPYAERVRSRAQRVVGVALVPLAIALVGVVVCLAVAPDVRAAWIVGGVTAVAVGISTLIAALYLITRR